MWRVTGWENAFVVDGLFFLYVRVQRGDFFLITFCSSDGWYRQLCSCFKISRLYLRLGKSLSSYLIRPWWQTDPEWVGSTLISVQSTRSVGSAREIAKAIATLNCNSKLDPPSFRPARPGRRLKYCERAETFPKLSSLIRLSSRNENEEFLSTISTFHCCWCCWSFPRRWAGKVSLLKWKRRQTVKLLWGPFCKLSEGMKLKKFC